MPTETLASLEIALCSIHGPFYSGFAACPSCTSAELLSDVACEYCEKRPGVKKDERGNWICEPCDDPDKYGCAECGRVITDGHAKDCSNHPDQIEDAAYMEWQQEQDERPMWAAMSRGFDAAKDAAEERSFAR